jgi:hypothetical protein
VHFAHSGSSHLVLINASLENTQHKKEGRKMKKQIQIEYNKETDGLRWIENISRGMRLVDYADKIANLRHTGWYTDREFTDESFRGIVYRLPSRKTGPVYFVGYDDPNNDDAARGEFRTDLADDNAAAHAADDIARIAAEKECEYQEVWRLGQSYADTFETVERERAKRSGLIREYRTLKSLTSLSSDQWNTSQLCRVFKNTIKDTRTKIKEALKERRDILKDNFVRGAMLDAFADGASISLDDAKALF